MFATEERGLEHSTIVGRRGLRHVATRPDRPHPRRTPLPRRPRPCLRQDEAQGPITEPNDQRPRRHCWRRSLIRRHGKVSNNPTVGFELPTSMHIAKKTATPELDELLAILADANENDHELAPVLTLAATTGMRRGELSGLRRSRLNLDRAWSWSLTRQSTTQAARLWSNQGRPARHEPLASMSPRSRFSEHIETMDKRAAELGEAVGADAYVFSLEPDCAKPMRPEFMTRRMRGPVQRMGLGAGDFDATILAMRKWTTTELMDAGFNPSAVSGRQGHTVQVMLEHYSSRRRSADQAAAEHLGSRPPAGRVVQPETE